MKGRLHTQIPIKFQNVLFEVVNLLVWSKWWEVCKFCLRIGQTNLWEAENKMERKITLRKERMKKKKNEEHFSEIASYHHGNWNIWNIAAEFVSLVYYQLIQGKKWSKETHEELSCQTFWKVKNFILIATRTYFGSTQRILSNVLHMCTKWTA